ncbi:MAG: carboxypeptidase-like regulatory domain-containing protein, partial [Candidatus Diapherotrites archaeon]
MTYEEDYTEEPEGINQRVLIKGVIVGIIILVIIGIAFLFLDSGESNTTLVTIEVSTQSGIPLKAADLEISGLDSILKLKTDKNGRASFDAELDKEIEITASKEGYEEKTRKVTVTKELIINLKLSKPLFDSKYVTITFVGTDNKKLVGKELGITLGCTGSGIFDLSEYTTNSGELTVEPPNGCNAITYTINGSGLETSRGSILGKEQLIELQTIKIPSGSVEITVKDGQNNRFLDGISVKLVDESGLVTGFQGYTSFGEISFENVEIGNYTAITEDPELEYGSKSITIGINPNQRTRKDILITKDLQLTATIEITDKRDRIPVQGAKVAVYNPDGFIVGEQETDSSGKASFALMERGIYTYIVSKENYRPADSGSFDTDDYPKASEQNFKIDLEKCTPTNCGALVVRVIDDEGLVAENAKVMILDADGFIQTSYGSKITDYNGNTDPFLNLDPEKAYKILVQKYPAEGTSSEITVEPLKENFAEVVLEIGTGTISITAEDSFGKRISFAEAELFTDYGKSLGIISLDSEGTGFLENVKADKKVYAVISKEGYLGYTTTAQQIIKDKFIFFNVLLEDEIRGNKPTIELDGIYNDAGVWVSEVAPGKKYEARLLLTVPKNFDEVGVFFRTGEKEHIEQDNIYITKVNAPGAKSIKGKDYKPKNGNTIITNGNAKWVTAVWKEPKEGKYKITIEFETTKEITSRTFLPVYYRTWGIKGSKYLRDPLDTELGEAEETNEKTALYAESYEKPLFEGIDSICSENFCFGHRLLNETTGIYEQEPYNLKSFSPYTLEFSITNNTEGIHDNAELSIKSTQDGATVSEDLIINSYSFTDADSKKVNSETPTFEIESLNLGDFRFNKTISGLLSIEPKSNIPASLEFEIISNQNKIMNNHVLFNTAGNEEMDITTDPKEIDAFVPTNLKIIVTQATGELEGFGIQDALIVVKKIAPDQSEQTFTGTTNGEGIAEISIPASSLGTKISIKAEKPGLNPKTIEIKISSEIAKFNPKEIIHSLTRNTKEQDVTFISIENLIGEMIYINKLRASGSFFGLLNEARMDNFLAGFVGTTIEGQKSSGIEYLSVFGEEANFLEEPQVVEGSIVIEFKSNFDAGTSWVYEIPTKTEINLGALPENNSCLVLSINKWEDSTITGQSTIEFELTNNCVNNNGELLNIDRLVSTIDWEEESIIGNVELTLMNPATGESVSELLQPGLWSNLISNVEPEVTYIGKLSFVSKPNTLGKKAKFTVNIDGQLQTDLSWQFIEANNSIDSEILIVHLEECIKSDYGFGGEQILELGQGTAEIFTLNSNACGNLRVDVRLCHEDTGCKGGSTEGGITVNPRNFTLKPGNAIQEITVVRENIPGIYGIKVEVRPEGGSWKRIGEVLITLDPIIDDSTYINPYNIGGGYIPNLFNEAGSYTNSEEPFTLSRYNFDLIEIGTKDTATLTNRFLSETITVDASACDWKTASNQAESNWFDIESTGLGVAALGLLGVKPALDTVKASASQISKETGESLTNSERQAEEAVKAGEKEVTDASNVVSKADDLDDAQGDLEDASKKAKDKIEGAV